MSAVEAQQRTAASPSALKTLTIEELSAIEVTSPGKREERVYNVATAITVITQEDLRRSGVRNIPEALRLATGVQVSMFNNASWPISARGFATTSANKIQVFFDGRSVYSPLFGGVFWEVQNTVIEDIDRIEVIRGPGATLWGGNAVNLVVNIITKAARFTQGGLAVLGGGAAERGFASVRYGGRLGGRSHYRLYGLFFDRDSLARATGEDAKDPHQTGQTGFRVDSELSGRDMLTVQGDLYRGRTGLLNREDISLHGGNLLARWTRTLRSGSTIQFQTFYDRTSRLVPLQLGEVRNTYDVELQHNLSLGGRHELVWGTGYRASNDATQATPLLFFEPSGRHLGQFAVFVQDVITLSPERVHLIAGVKLERNAFSGWTVQPSVRLAWTPTSRHTLWGAVSRAVRIPTRFDEDLRIQAGGNFTLISGSPGFRPEKLVAYEAGYRVRPKPSLWFDIATYFNDYKDLRSQERTTAAAFPVVLGNKLLAQTFGVEASAAYQVREGWRLTMSYANLQRQLSFAADSTDITRARQEGADPRTQFSLRSAMDLPRRVTLDFWMRHVSALPTTPNVPAYVVFDARLAWRANEAVEVALVGRNLPQRRHMEFGPNGELVRRSVYASATWRF